MTLRRNPLLPIGLLLLALGLGNWYTGWSKAFEYEDLIAAGGSPSEVGDFQEFSRLTPRTNASLLRPLERGIDANAFIDAKLDFYRIVRSGGRILMLSGAFLSAASAIRMFYRRRKPRALVLPDLV